MNRSSSDEKPKVFERFGNFFGSGRKKKSKGSSDGFSEENTSSTEPAVLGQKNEKSSIPDDLSYEQEFPVLSVSSSGEAGAKDHQVKQSVEVLQVTELKGNTIDKSTLSSSTPVTSFFQENASFLLEQPETHGTILTSLQKAGENTTVEKNVKHIRTLPVRLGSASDSDSEKTNCSPKRLHVFVEETSISSSTESLRGQIGENAVTKEFDKGSTLESDLQKFKTTAESGFSELCVAKQLSAPEQLADLQHIDKAPLDSHCLKSDITQSNEQDTVHFAHSFGYNEQLQQGCIDSSEIKLKKEARQVLTVEVFLQPDNESVPIEESCTAEQAEMGKKGLNDKNRRSEKRGSIKHQENQQSTQGKTDTIPQSVGNDVEPAAQAPEVENGTLSAIEIEMGINGNESREIMGQQLPEQKLELQSEDSCFPTASASMNSLAQQNELAILAVHSEAEPQGDTPVSTTNSMQGSKVNTGTHQEECQTSVTVELQCRKGEPSKQTLECSTFSFNAPQGDEIICGKDGDLQLHGYQIEHKNIRKDSSESHMKGVAKAHVSSQKSEIKIQIEQQHHQASSSQPDKHSSVADRISLFENKVTSSQKIDFLVTKSIPCTSKQSKKFTGRATLKINSSTENNEMDSKTPIAKVPETTDFSVFEENCQEAFASQSEKISSRHFQTHKQSVSDVQLQSITLKSTKDTKISRTLGNSSESSQHDETSELSSPQDTTNDGLKKRPEPRENADCGLKETMVPTSSKETKHSVANDEIAASHVSKTATSKGQLSATHQGVTTANESMKPKKTEDDVIITLKSSDMPPSLQPEQITEFVSAMEGAINQSQMKSNNSEENSVVVIQGLEDPLNRLPVVHKVPEEQVDGTPIPSNEQTCWSSSPISTAKPSDDTKVPNTTDLPGTLTTNIELKPEASTMHSPLPNCRVDSSTEEKTELTKSGTTKKKTINKITKVTSESPKSGPKRAVKEPVNLSPTGSKLPRPIGKGITRQISNDAVEVTGEQQTTMENSEGNIHQQNSESTASADQNTTKLQTESTKALCESPTSPSKLPRPVQKNIFRQVSNEGSENVAEPLASPQKTVPDKKGNISFHGTKETVAPAQRSPTSISQTDKKKSIVSKKERTKEQPAFNIKSDKSPSAVKCATGKHLEIEEKSCVILIQQGSVKDHVTDNGEKVVYTLTKTDCEPVSQELPKSPTMENENTVIKSLICSAAKTKSDNVGQPELTTVIQVTEVKTEMESNMLQDTKSMQMIGDALPSKGQHSLQENKCESKKEKEISKVNCEHSESYHECTEKEPKNVAIKDGVRSPSNSRPQKKESNKKSMNVVAFVEECDSSEKVTVLPSNATLLAEECSNVSFNGKLQTETLNGKEPQPQHTVIKDEDILNNSLQCNHAKINTENTGQSVTISDAVFNTAKTELGKKTLQGGSSRQMESASVPAIVHLTTQTEELETKGDRGISSVKDLPRFCNVQVEQPLENNVILQVVASSLPVQISKEKTYGESVKSETFIEQLHESETAKDILKSESNFESNKLGTEQPEHISVYITSELTSAAHGGATDLKGKVNEAELQKSATFKEKNFELEMKTHHTLKLDQFENKRNNVASMVEDVFPKSHISASLGLSDNNEKERITELPSDNQLCAQERKNDSVVAEILLEGKSKVVAQEMSSLKQVHIESQTPKKQQEALSILEAEQIIISVDSVGNLANKMCLKSDNSTLEELSEGSSLHSVTDLTSDSRLGSENCNMPLNIQTVTERLTETKNSNHGTAASNVLESGKLETNTVKDSNYASSLGGILSNDSGLSSATPLSVEQNSSSFKNTSSFIEKQNITDLKGKVMSEQGEFNLEKIQNQTASSKTLQGSTLQKLQKPVEETNKINMHSSNKGIQSGQYSEKSENFTMKNDKLKNLHSVKGTIEQPENVNAVHNVTGTKRPFPSETLRQGGNIFDSSNTPSGWLDLEHKFVEKKHTKANKLGSFETEDSDNILDKSDDFEEFLKNIKNCGSPFSIPQKQRCLRPTAPPPFALPSIKEDRFEKVFDPNSFTFGLGKTEPKEPPPTTLFKMQSAEMKSKLLPKRVTAEQSVLFKSLQPSGKNSDAQDISSTTSDGISAAGNKISRLEKSSVLSSLTNHKAVPQKNSFTKNTSIQSSISSTSEGQAACILNGANKVSESMQEAIQNSVFSDVLGTGDLELSRQAFSEVKLPEYMQKYVDPNTSDTNFFSQSTFQMPQYPNMSTDLGINSGVDTSKEFSVFSKPGQLNTTPSFSGSSLSHFQNVGPRVQKRPGKVIIYDGPQFKGKEIMISQDIEDATSLKLSPIISVKVVRGCWLFFEKPHFQGQIIALEEEERELRDIWNVVAIEQNVSPYKEEIPVVIGSVKLAVKDYNLPEINLFTEIGGLGRKTTLYDESVDTFTYGIPLNTSSISVNSGIWFIFAEPDFQGIPAILLPGTYPNPEYWNSQHSIVRSLRPLKMGGLKVEHPTEPKAILYEKPFFEGKHLEVGNDIFSFQEEDVNDDASTTCSVSNFGSVGSFKILRGIWVAYEKPGFEGPQYLLEEGEYKDWSDWACSPITIQSLRTTLSDFLAPHVKFFSEPDFGDQGLIIDIMEQVANFDLTMYGSRTQSIEVIGGVWVAFEKPNFSGQSYILEKGLYSSCEDWGATNFKISSIQPVTLENPYGLKSKFKIQVFSEPHFQGERQILESSAMVMPENLTVKSCKVLAGGFVAYDEEHFRGNQFVIEEGNYPNLTSIGFPSLDTHMRSLQIIGFEFSQPSITLYSKINFKGKKLIFTSEVVNLQLLGYDPHIFSLDVLGGLWVVYDQFNYKGRQILLGPHEIADWHKFSGWHKIASLRPLLQKQVYFKLRNRMTGTLMSITGGLDDINLIRIQAVEDTGLDDQVWCYKDGLLKSRIAEDCCVETTGAIVIAGCRLGLSLEIGKENHFWTISPQGIIRLKIRPELVLEVKGGHQYDTNQVILNTFDENKLNQIWDMDIL
ncbi:uncharacterized protein crybg1a isoform X2 [Erpetoichthys calabaricus]|uniref:uncharacterized protein crybg1a isoform X2 n=1 Tax=Erpetoichthys calabaricus TaxID=27687 RepID=UPI00223447BA|nr:uncharacterized protein crybg1a isoform X2 [Erpetoichthys calabaricus]